MLFLFRKEEQVIQFEKIGMSADIFTKIEYDENEPKKVTFSYTDAIGQTGSKNVNLSDFGLDINYILDIIQDAEQNGAERQFKTK